MKRTEKIEIRLTKIEKEKLMQIKFKLGYSSLSEMIRHVFFDLSKKRCFKDEEIEDEEIAGDPLK